MALLKRRKSRKTGEELCVIKPTEDEVIEQRGSCELSEEFLRNFLRNVQQIVKDCISLFFRGREMYYGGEIGEDQLHCPAYVSTVMNCDIGAAVDAAYAAMGPWHTDEDEERQADFVMGILDQCARHGIPKCFAGGLLVMYMELCLGMDLRQNSTVCAA